ncbi:diguanylate cyclase [Pseudohalocynthiibacter aestuariivivens]|nr:diguanylate cyclase [Pseudohalocynthiibacter aestuariivivens]QIE45276.1 diguanylate cyclase [Pseudohalocynthiibacter aestuariivivens]
MSGNILIVDAVATNRIVLKVKLTSAHFSVSQAANAADALRCASATPPDMIIVGTPLPDADIAGFIDQLRARRSLAATPVVALLSPGDWTGRTAALRAGADDVVSQPLDERTLMARIRSLLRQHHSLQDLRLNTSPDNISGFADAQSRFAVRGQIAIVAADRASAMALRTRLSRCSAHHLTIITADQPMTAQIGARAPDIFVIMTDQNNHDTGQKVMAELRASPDTRHSHIMAVVQDAAPQMVATLLDLGANDIMTDVADTQELALRLNNQILRKQVVDHLRCRMQDGLRDAMIDPLTGLYNRRFALPFLQQLIEAPNEHSRPFAVMVADLDHFKRVNDTLGHASGDAVLRQVATLLQGNLQDADMIARIGGEEFLIVLPDTPCAVARGTADRLCQLIRDAAIALPDGGTPTRVTISIGVTLVHDARAPGPLSLDTVLSEADRALYAAKARGRNTVTYSAMSAA